MILENLPGWVWTLIWLGAGIAIFRFSVNNIMKPIIRFKETRYKQNLAAGGTVNPLMSYNSAGEMVANAEAGIIAQMEDISRELRNRKIDPMQDPAYQQLMNQRDKIQAWKSRLQNPLVGMLDQTFFPIVKGWIPDIQKAGKRLMKEL